MWVLARAAARARFSEYMHDPPDSRVAQAKRPCLKPPSERNPQWNPFLNKAGDEITVAKSVALVEHMAWKGHWALVLGESYRTQTRGPARAYVMEFVVPRNGSDLAPYIQEIKLAGYEHNSLCSMNGWAPFELPANAKGWGKECTDVVRLADWHAERAYSAPMPHYAGDGWTCRGQHYKRVDYPKANEHGPYGQSGPLWTSIA
jgi:hypothetical protein